MENLKYSNMMVKGLSKYEYNRQYYTRNNISIQRKKKQRVNTNLKSRLCRIIYNARIRREVDFDVDFLLELYKKQEGLCALTGETMTIHSTGTRTTSNQVSADRIDNNKDYTKDNVRLVTSKINMMRGVMSTEDFIDLCKKVVQWNV